LFRLIFIALQNVGVISALSVHYQLNVSANTSRNMQGICQSVYAVWCSHVKELEKLWSQGTVVIFSQTSRRVAAI